MKRSDVTVLVVIVVAVVAGAAWWLSRMERVDRRVYVGPRGEARKEPWRACVRTFDELGLPAEHASELLELPPTDHVLFLGALAVRDNSQRAREIVEWVERGGVLVFLVPSAAEQRVLLRRAIERKNREMSVVSAFGVALRVDPSVDVAAFDKKAEREERIAQRGELPLPTTEVDVGFGPREIALTTDLWFETLAGDGHSDYALVRRRGSGAAVFVSSDAWLRNERFAAGDHALFAWDLSQIATPRAGALFVPAVQHGGLLGWLADEAWTVLVASAALIALWIWRRAARFGPVLADAPRDRRDFSEHVEAAGEFLWRNGHAARLVAAPRDELARRLATLRPDLAASPPEVIHAELAHASGLSPAAVRAAVTSSDVADPHSFHRIVRDLAQLRSNL